MTCRRCHRVTIAHRQCCQPCLDYAADRYQSRQLGLTAYRPWEEILSLRVRILRAIRHFDWVTAGELFDAMGVEQNHDSLERNACQTAMTRLVRGGLVQVRKPISTGRLGHLSVYRITPSGLQRLREELVNDGEVSA